MGQNPKNLKKIQTAIEVVCEKLSEKFKAQNLWVLRRESTLWREAVACILGSRVSYEKTVSATSSLRTAKLLDLQKNLSELSEYRLAVRKQLSAPLVLKGVEYGKYPFPRARAKQIWWNLKYFYGSGDTLKKILLVSANEFETRKLLVSSIKGIGPKQASLFLRNIGYTSNLAILDVHVLRYMNLFRIWLGDLSDLANLGEYQKAESVFRKRAERGGFSVAQFDLAVWIVMRLAKREGLAA